MDFKVGFWTVLAVCVCAVITTIVMSTLYALKNNENSSNGVRDERSTTKNNFLESHASQVFPGAQVRTTRDNTTLVNSKLALVSNFHNSDPSSTALSLKKSGKTVFILDGEPNDLKSLPAADLIITTKLDPSLLPIPHHVATSVYLPCYSSFLSECGIDPQALVQTEPNNTINQDFAVFCYTNSDESFPGVKARNAFYRLMQKRTNNAVSNLGKSLANEPHAGLGTQGHFTTNRQLFKKFRFVIAFENREIEGYISEKLVNPFLAGSIPIYCGAPDVSSHFNPKRFINVRNFENFDACIDEVLRLESDKQAYADMLREPCLLNNEVDPDKFALNLGGKLYNEIYQYVPKGVTVRPNMITSNEVSFITFADGGRYKRDRVVKEALDSGYFDSCTGFGPESLPKEFKSQFDNYMQANARGFGYWVWKPLVIQMTLAKARDNDLVVFADSGCSVLKGHDRKMLEYYRLLCYGEKFDVLGFEIRYRASHWTKGDLFSTVGVAMDNDSLQLTSSVIMVRKTANSVALINRWAELMHSDPHNIDDTPSRLPNHRFFQEHRHDQSCWDLLSRGMKYAGLCVIKDSFMDARDMDVPLQPSRKRK